MYLIDRDIFITQILPPHWRKDLWRIHLIRALLTPLFLVINELEKYRAKTFVKVNLSCQVIVLEQHLNRVLQYDLNYISISDSSTHNEFVVNIPTSLPKEKVRGVEYEIRKYISADKQFIIKKY